MYWWNGVAWKRTTALWVWNAGAWTVVHDCWIWDGAAWQHCYSDTFGTPVSMYIPQDGDNVPVGGSVDICTTVGVDAFGNEQTITGASWSILSGPGSINSVNGHFTSDAVTTGDTVVQAYNATYSITATATLHTV
jgi:hypothetical protein